MSTFRARLSVHVPTMRKWGALALMIVAAANVVAYLPTTISRLNAHARQNAARDSLGQSLAAADSLDIDNGLVATARELLPEDATFAVLPPSDASARSLNPITVGALDGYFAYDLLPRRSVSTKAAQFLLCYGCDDSEWGRRVRWIWSNGAGLKIGRKTPP
jgi:hypothetical protein